MTVLLLTLVEAESLAARLRSPLREAVHYLKNNHDSTDGRVKQGEVDLARIDLDLDALRDAREGLARHWHKVYVGEHGDVCGESGPDGTSYSCPDAEAHRRAAVRASAGLRHIATLYGVEP